MVSFATFSKHSTRVVFFALIIVQCIFLAAYPATYRDNNNWYCVSMSFGLALFVWIGLVIKKKAKLRRLFYVWGLYIIGALFPNIAIISIVVGDSLDKTKLLGPNTLKAVLCITPLLLLLLLHSADDSDENEKYRKLVSKLSFQMAIDLFDVVDMIDIVLDEIEYDYGIPKGIRQAVIVLACFGVLFSICQLAENKLAGGEVELRYWTSVCRNIGEIVLINLSFLIIRAVVFFKYRKEASIFIAKNIIGIIISLLEIRQNYTSR